MAKLSTWLMFVLATAATAQDANITQPIADLERLLAAEPLVITRAEISRPTVQADITLRADVSLGGAPPLRVKLRRAEPGASVFNNVPHYDLAAYELQKLFLDPAEYVVPPTALHFVARADIARYQPAAARTFLATDQVLAVVQVWLSDIASPPDIYSAQRFDADPLYARYIGQLNVLTYLIEHRDANRGNFLIGRAETGARVFSIDHGVAFSSADSDRGDVWRDMRVKRLPADTVARLRTITLPMLQQRLGVLAQWKLEGDRYVPTAIGANQASSRGVRRWDKGLQVGLTAKEISSVHWLLGRLLKRIDAGEFTLVPAAK